MLRSWPLPVRFVLACVVPALFGGLCGYVLGASAAGYVALSVLGAIGGVLAGMEHDGARAGAARGVTGGVLFGVLLIAVHAASNDTATVVVPHPLVLLVAMTAASGTALGAGGGWLQRRFRISPSR
jgi:hypothetical protein